MPTRSLFPMSDTAVGMAIRTQMRERDLLQKQFAHLMNINPSHLSQLLNGRAPLTPAIAARLHSVGIDGTFLYLCSAITAIKLEQEKLGGSAKSEDQLYVL